VRVVSENKVIQTISANYKKQQIKINDPWLQVQEQVHLNQALPSPFLSKTMYLKQIGQFKVTLSFYSANEDR